MEKERRKKPEFHTPVYEMALKQFDIASKKLGLDPNVASRLRSPKRALIVSVPIKMDDGNVKVFEGYRVQHSMVLGPAKGGNKVQSERDVKGRASKTDKEICNRDISTNRS